MGLIYGTSKTNMVAVNTAVGPINIPEIVTQGSAWGPVLCSNSIDTVGKYCTEQGQFYRYKKIVRLILILIYYL